MVISFFDVISDYFETIEHQIRVPELCALRYFDFFFNYLRCIACRCELKSKQVQYNEENFVGVLKLSPLEIYACTFGASC